MQFIRQNATHKVVLGPFVDVGDGFTPETGITLGAADEAEAILHDNGTVVDISSYTWAAITTADGYYHLTLQSGISSTVGHLTIIVQDDSVCLPVKAQFTVIEEAVYDMFYAASATGNSAATTTIASDLVIIASDLLQVYSDTTIIASDVVQVYSDTTIIASDTAAINTQTTTIASDLVIIASDLLQVYSDTTIIVSDTTAIESAGGGLSAAQDSKLTKVTSDVVIIGSDLSQVYSDTTILVSDTTAINTQTTTIASDLVILTSDVAQVYSDTTVLVSDTTAINTQTTTIASDLVIVASDLLQVYSDTTVIASDVVQIYSDTAVISSLNQGIIYGSAATGTLSTTQATTDLTGYADDQLIGRILTVTSGDAEGEQTDITDYASASGLLTFTALTVAMANNDTFKIT